MSNHSDNTFIEFSARGGEFQINHHLSIMIDGRGEVSRNQYSAEVTLDAETFSRIRRLASQAEAEKPSRSEDTNHYLAALFRKIFSINHSSLLSFELLLEGRSIAIPQAQDHPVSQLCFELSEILAQA